MYQWIYMASDDAGLDSVAENITGLGGVTAEWKETGNGYGWVIECDDMEDIDIIARKMAEEGFRGVVYRV